MEKQLASALECLERVALGDDVLISASRALNFVLAASIAEPDIKSASPAMSAKLFSSLQCATPVVTQAVSGELVFSSLNTGLEATLELICLIPDQDLERRQLHVGLLSSELVTLHCQRELVKWGGPIVRPVSTGHPTSVTPH